MAYLPLSPVEFLVVLVMTFHLLLCPFSKVEESFNTQAIHDILHHGLNISQYDHLEFPGVVPRSFLGPAAVVIATYPVVWCCQTLHVNKVYEQHIVRFALGLFVAVGFLSYARAVGEKLGKTVKLWLILTTVTQFHFAFYMSRTLPNVFALALVLGALAAWLRQQHQRFLWLSGAAILVFRSELALFLGPILLAELVSGRLSVKAALACAVPAGVALLGLTVGVDSFFWRRWLWPEGEVLWYNTVLNKSSQWGTFPFLWYFYSALPRALSVSVALVPMGLWLRRPVWRLLWPALVFVFLYSFLPHKELRFILYTFPIFNTATAVAVSSLVQSRAKSRLRSLLALGAVGLLVGNLLTTLAFLHTARLNYPGGHALHRLHQLETAQDVHVHIDVFTAQTGVTRFAQSNPAWIYNKTEDLKPGDPDMMSYSHLLIGVLSEDEHEVQPYLRSHQVLDKVEAFDGFRLQKTFPFIHIRTKQKIWILKKKQET